MSFKIAFFDIDNTIYDGFNRRFSDGVVTALKKAQSKGLKICLCTSRPNDSIEKLGCFKLGIKWDAVIGSSGGTVKIGDKYIKSSTIDEDLSKRFFDYLIQKNISFEMIGLETRWICGGFNDCANQFYSFFEDFAPEATKTHKEQLTQFHLFCTSEFDEDIKATFPGLVFSRYMPFAVDILPIVYQKGEGIDSVLEYFGYTEDEAIGFGDDLQDISISKHVREFVAMENAKDEVKAVATYITGHCSSDGIEQALRHFRLI